MAGRRTADEGHAHGEHDHAHHDHDHDHEHGHEHGEEDRRIRVLHGASPFCWWSWGYEGTLERLKLLYGDQIKVNVYQVPVWDDLEEHHRTYGTDDPATYEEWTREAEELMGLPLGRDALKALPRSCVPGTLMVHAAEAVAPGAGARLARRIAYHANVEAGPDLQDTASLLRLAEACGAPRKAVEQAFGDGTAQRSLDEDAQSYHALGLNFYALQARDFEGRTVTIEHAFEAARMEEAVEWLARGTLERQPLPEPAAYLAARAPVSLRELQEVFQLGPAEARRAAEPAERAGGVARREVLGHVFWVPKR